MSGDAVRIGFVPLVDCALLAVAQEKGFFARYRIDAELRKAQSWGQVRDKLQARELDAAHLLITVPLQTALEHPGEPPPLQYAFTLSRNGNGIILSNALWNHGVRDAVGLSEWLDANPERPLRLGVVFPRGTQEYFLRSWLARGKLALGDRITLFIIPPQEMVGRLRKGEIDGFCVGEPWTRRATESKLGRLVAASASLLPGLGEKVLGVRAEWHREHAPEHMRVLRALSEASEWMADAANLEAAVEIVCSKRYVNTSKSVVDAALRDALGAQPQAPGAPAGIRSPVPAHARWYLDQMALWGHATGGVCAAADLDSICLDGFYRSGNFTVT